MKTNTFSYRRSARLFPIAALCLALSCALQGATQDQLNKKFSVQPGGKVVVDVDFGSISVSTNANAEVAVDVWRKVSRGSKGDEESYLRNNPVQIDQDGNTITIRCHAKEARSRSWFSFGRNQNEARYTITVPAQFNAQLATAGGGIKVSDLNGTVKAHTSGGGLDFARLHGPLDGDTSGGGIEMEDCVGELKIHTSGGGISVAGGSGSLQGDTSGGSVAVRKFHGPTHVETSGGGVTIADVTGKVHGSTSGGSIKASFSSPITDSVRLETSGGGVTVRVPADVAFDLDAETSAGGVHSEFAVGGGAKAERDHLKGPVNGGGKSVYLRSSAGSIHIVRAQATQAEAESK
jgi:hypothetical protein